MCEGVAIRVLFFTALILARNFPRFILKVYFPLACPHREDDGWLVDPCVYKVQSHSPLARPVALSAVVASRQALITLQVSLSARKTPRAHPLRFPRSIAIFVRFPTRHQLRRGTDPSDLIRLLAARLGDVFALLPPRLGRASIGRCLRESVAVVGMNVKARLQVCSLVDGARQREGWSRLAAPTHATATGMKRYRCPEHKAEPSACGPFVGYGRRAFLWADGRQCYCSRARGNVLLSENNRVDRRLCSASSLASLRGDVGAMK